MQLAELLSLISSDLSSGHCETLILVWVSHKVGWIRISKMRNEFIHFTWIVNYLREQDDAKFDPDAKDPLITKPSSVDTGLNEIRRLERRKAQRRRKSTSQNGLGWVTIAIIITLNFRFAGYLFGFFLFCLIFTLDISYICHLSLNIVFTIKTDPGKVIVISEFILSNCRVYRVSWYW